MFIQVKPLLQVTNQEAAIALKEEELKVIKDKLSKREVEYTEVVKRMNQLNEERSLLVEQLQQVVISLQRIKFYYQSSDAFRHFLKTIDEIFFQKNYYIGK